MIEMTQIMKTSVVVISGKLRVALLLQVPNYVNLLRLVLNYIDTFIPRNLVSYIHCKKLDSRSYRVQILSIPTVSKLPSCPRRITITLVESELSNTALKKGVLVFIQLLQEIQLVLSKFTETSIVIPPIQISISKLARFQ